MDKKIKPNLKPVSFRIDADLYDALQRMAFYQSRSITKQLEAILKKATIDFQKKPVNE